jgi:hypothetical protein
VGSHLQFRVILTLIFLAATASEPLARGEASAAFSWTFPRVVVVYHDYDGEGQVCYLIDELSALVHPRDGHLKVFAMIDTDVYLDESGIHGGAPVCIIAGYFGRVHHWKPLEKQWRATLKRHNFPMEEFHAKELVGRAEYEEMLMALASVIANCRVHPVTDGIVVSDFFSFSLNQRKYLTGATFCGGPKVVKGGNPERPYFVPFQLVLQKVTDYTPPLGKAHFTFGIDRTFYGYASSMFAKIKNTQARPTEWQSKTRLGNALSALAKETPELQAADLLSYLTYLHSGKVGFSPTKRRFT